MSQTSITYPLPIAFEGALADTSDIDTLPGVSAEASAEIPFGVVVAKGATDTGTILVAASNAILTGVTIHSHKYDNGPNGEMGTVGLKPKTCLDVLRKGRIYVRVEEAVVAYDRAYIRYAAGAGGTQLGAFRKSAVANETIDARKQFQYITSASAGAIAVVEVDMAAS